ncbi:hypothetical protein PDE_04564 [Penicillium oxalicum 114-2]|uniref:NmrA-like domain-containing protein n=1 Tax=Penicillium oxalicum (strain 114-2 / CGMCC 5302) TaxID=933388 RepID=S7ZH49_PENO1|nr:hypothetical protein PDE_04564 [Penicillium oxalicum 114-2]
MVENRITNVAIVGASGNSGRFMAQAILETGKHTLTALTRAGSNANLPAGVICKVIDYTKPETIVAALRGQDALVVTLPGQAPLETEVALIEAAGEAGVSWILNDWAVDTQHEDLVKDVPPLQKKVSVRKAIEKLGKSNYISLCTSFWYEWSMAIPDAFGIDLINHTAIFFDEGDTRITISTWPQVGRAVAAILSLPVKAEGSAACLETLKNKVVYCKSFTLNQQEMLESACRVTQTTKDDWKISKVPCEKRYEEGQQQMNKGEFDGFVKVLYTRVFYPDGCGNIDHKGTINELLGLPVEDLDTATLAAIERAKAQP